MKLIFLDIDGVLITRRSHIAFAPRRGGMMVAPDPVCTKVLQRVCDAYLPADHRCVRLVVSSTFRTQTKECVAFMIQCGLWRFVVGHDQGLEVGRPGGVWMTPVIGRHVKNKRGAEIAEWFRIHRPGRLGPKVSFDDYLILDDNSDVDKRQRPHLVLTTHETGLSSFDVRTIYEFAKYAPWEFPVA